MENILDYIALENPAAALDTIDKIEKTGNDLGKMAIGHYGRIEGTYEIGVTHSPYIIAYMIERQPSGGESIIILRVIHTARNWTGNKWPN